jgi:hypothetical protein
MATFSQSILKAVDEYKILIKRMYPRTSPAKFKELGIKRLQLRSMSEVELFRLGQKLLLELEKELATNPQQAKRNLTYFSGIDRFYQHLNKIINSYQICNNQVVNAKQQNACELINLIQVLTFDHRRLELPETQNQICVLISKLTKQGDQELLNLVGEALVALQKKGAKIPKDLQQLIVQVQTENVS